MADLDPAAVLEQVAADPRPRAFLLAVIYDDYASLRRYLVDEEFLSRSGGEYWRTGGTVSPSPDR
jgi:Uncharacterized protein conserved in bacteria (DUF2087)